MLRPFLVISFLSATTGALANPVPLTSDDLKALAGSVVEIDTPLGTKLPIRFGTDGLVSAEAGELAPLLGSAKDRGRWWVDGDKMCSKFFRWFDAEVRCITVTRDGSRLFWRKDDGETGTATLIEASPPAVPKETVAAAKSPKSSRPPADEVKVALGSVPAPIKQTPAKRRVEQTPEPEPARAEPSPAAAVAAPSPPAVMPPAAVVVAEAAPAPRAETFDDVPMMRFGGAGLLEASSRVGAETPTEVAALPLPTRPAAPAAGPADDAPAATRSLSKAAPAAKAPAKRGIAAKRKSEAQKADATTTASVRSVPLYRVQHVRRYDVLNVRRGPSELHASVAAIPSTGRRVEITGACQADWCPVRYGSVRGWVNRFYLAEEGSRQESASPVYVARP